MSWQGALTVAAIVFELGLSAVEPSTPTGLNAHIDYGSQPKRQAALTVDLPPGTRFNESAVPACTATDAELATRGLGACPAASEVGRGTGSLASPFGPLEGDLHILHAPGELVNAATFPGSDRVVVVARGKIDGSRLVYDTADDYPPPTPGQPPGQEVEQTIDAGPFMTTPPACPRDGLWHSRLTVTYDDATTDTATSATPCHALTVRPRTVRLGVLRRFRFAVSDPTAACRAATIRFGGRRIRANADGDATAARRFRRAGTRTAVAEAPGCPGTRTTVTVRP